MSYGMAVQSPESMQQAKQRLRVRLLAARRAMGTAERRLARDAIRAHLTATLGGSRCVAAFLPLPTEPLDPLLLDELALRMRVLVPVVTGAEPLDWCEHPGPVGPGEFGFSTPLGPRLGPGSIADADAVLVPALAVDRNGRRLGRGGGHYDRSLELLRRRLRGDRLPPRIALIFEDELLDAVPFDALDQPVTAVVTPGSGFTALG
jgi:5-formyltetrahydrofolate cyclo-ligase